MSVKEYVATMLFGMIKGDSLTMSDKTMSNRYAKGFYVIPRIYCKDGVKGTGFFFKYKIKEKDYIVLLPRKEHIFVIRVIRVLLFGV